MLKFVVVPRQNVKRLNAYFGKALRTESEYKWMKTFQVTIKADSSFISDLALNTSIYSYTCNMMAYPWLLLLIESCSETGCERKLMVMFAMIPQGKLDSHRQYCHNFIYCRPVRRALLPSHLPLLDTQMHSYTALRATAHSATAAVFAYMSVAGCPPLYFSCHAASLSSLTGRLSKLTQLCGERRELK